MMRTHKAIVAGLIGLSLSVAAVAAKTVVPDGFHLKRGTTLVHKASGTQFPLHLAGFTRALSSPMDLTGHDIVIGYRETIGGDPVVARIAMIHLEGMTPKEHFLGMKAVVGTYFQDMPFTDIAIQGEGPFDPPGLRPGSGYQGRFRAMHGEIPYEISLSTVKLGYWDVRVTAAYPASAAAQAQADIAKLVIALQRTAPKQKPAPKH